MNNINSVLIEGNLVRDPELSYTPKGTAVTQFTVASNRFYKQDGKMVSEASFIPVTTWARLAEVCSEYLTKGRGVRVNGRLKQDRWTDADGKPRSKIHIVAERVEFKPQAKKAEAEPEQAEPDEVPFADEKAPEAVAV
jgi:single-strand DNA-binding protein